MKYCTHFAVLFWICVCCSNACHFYHYEARRRRNVDGEVEDTSYLREYFTACMNYKLPDPDYDWRSAVDFTILESIWHLNTIQVFCSPAGGLPTSECWQENLDEYLIDSFTSIMAKQCIAEYAEDQPVGENRYANATTRSKRSLSLPGFPYNRRPPTYPRLPSSYADLNPAQLGNRFVDYAACLQTTAPNVSKVRVNTNYTQLSAFIRKTTLVGCDQKKQSRYTNFWPYKFIALTRSDSGIRSTLKVCGNRVYPPASFWSSWSKWSKCRRSCKQQRIRSCRSGINPKVTANNCPGRKVTVERQERQCIGGQCLIDSQWSHWLDWSPCTSDCGPGTQTRERRCLSSIYLPLPQHKCPGRSKIYRSCDNKGFTQWSSWGTCGTKCTRSRKRVCTVTNASDSSSKTCRGGSCPKGYSWGNWSRYGTCSKTCGRGTERRLRVCYIDLRPVNGGKPRTGSSLCERFLKGKSSQTRICIRPPCASWSSWSKYGRCIPSNRGCGSGFRTRTRSCKIGRRTVSSRLCKGFSSGRRRCSVRCIPIIK